MINFTDMYLLQKIMQVFSITCWIPEPGNPVAWTRPKTGPGLPQITNCVSTSHKTGNNSTMWNKTALLSSTIGATDEVLLSYDDSGLLYKNCTLCTVYTAQLLTQEACTQRHAVLATAQNCSCSPTHCCEVLDRFVRQSHQKILNLAKNPLFFLLFVVMW